MHRLSTFLAIVPTLAATQNVIASLDKRIRRTEIHSRVMQAMLKMLKLDIGLLKKAYEQT
jgi:hypothetical protein